jgi:hypothetical protein
MNPVVLLETLKSISEYFKLIGPFIPLFGFLLAIMLRFLPESYLSYLWLAELRNSNQAVVGLVLVASILALSIQVVYLTVKQFPNLKNWFLRQLNLRKIPSLSAKEQTILKSFVENHTTHLRLRDNDIAVRRLSQMGLIRSGFSGQRDGTWTYHIDIEVYDYVANFWRK